MPWRKKLWTFFSFFCWSGMWAGKRHIDSRSLASLTKISLYPPPTPVSDGWSKAWCASLSPAAPTHLGKVEVDDRVSERHCCVAEVALCGDVRHQPLVHLAQAPGLPLRRHRRSAASVGLQPGRHVGSGPRKGTHPVAQRAPRSSSEKKSLAGRRAGGFRDEKYQYLPTYPLVLCSRERRR